MDNTTKPAVWIQLSPILKSYQLEPGKIVDDTFTVQNIGSETFSYKLYAAPYNVTNELYDADFTTENSFSQIYHWVTFRDSDGEYRDTVSYTIKPDEIQEINMRIVSPKNLPSGSQHAIIFAESLKKSNVQGVTAISRVGLNLRAAATGETHLESQITNWTAPSYLASGNITSSISIKNTGNVDTTAGYNYTVRNIYGNILYEQNNTFDVFADTTRRFNFEWEETPLVGIYKIQMTIAAADDTKNFSQVVLVLPPLIASLIIAVITFFIVMTMLFIRKRRSRAIVY